MGLLILYWSFLCPVAFNIVFVGWHGTFSIVVVFPLSRGFLIGENIILVPIFWGHSQFSPYILRAVNLVPAIFKSQSI